MKICIEIISTEQTCWIPFPNGDLSSAINDFTEGRDYETTAIINNETNIFTNTFHKCDIFKLNILLIELEENHHFDTEDFKCLSILSLLLEDRNYNVDEVAGILFSNQYKVFHAKDMGDVAKEYLEETSSWYKEAKENESFFDRYFDFKEYGEQVLGSSGSFLQDKDNEIIIEIFD
jgi:hypothetical protein